MYVDDFSGFNFAKAPPHHTQNLSLLTLFEDSYQLLPPQWRLQYKLKQTMVLPIEQTRLCLFVNLSK